MLFNKEHFGNRISEELSEILKRNTNGSERMDAANHGGISKHTVQSVITRAWPITKNSSDAIIYLMRVALKNATETKRIMGEDEDYLLETLEGHEVINN